MTTFLSSTLFILLDRARCMGSDLAVSEVLKIQRQFFFL